MFLLLPQTKNKKTDQNSTENGYAPKSTHGKHGMRPTVMTMELCLYY